MRAIKVCCFLCSLLFFADVLAAAVAQNHQLKGVGCEGCHTQMPVADYSKCIGCHGGKERLSQTNSQHSSLKNAEIPCSICHKGHQDR